jgi:hypothetical protein
MLEKMDKAPPQVTQEQWSAWRRNPITEHLFYEIESYVLDKLTKTLPNENGLAIAYRRDGALSMANHFLSWDIPVEGGDE